MSQNSLIQPLPSGPLDIVGDVHGEWDALQNLLQHLGYDEQARHPDGRTLIFVGDLCDRGPNTPAVLDWLLPLVEQKKVCAVLGNHEINLIRQDEKDGAGWFFPARVVTDQPKYAPFVQVNAAQREYYLHAVNQWPIALEREDLRIVHAAWHKPAIEQARTLALGTARKRYDEFEAQAQAEAKASALIRQIAQEKSCWPHSLEDGSHCPPHLSAHAARELLKQTHNPLKVLTTGLEKETVGSFYAGGKWRFTERLAWWDGYDDATPVVIGHYWRRFTAQAPRPGAQPASTQEALFDHIPPTAWHGKRHNVFCVDYSVGARWSERCKGHTSAQQSQFKLAALRWPEKTLVLDTGEQLRTTQGG